MTERDEQAQEELDAVRKAGLYRSLRGLDSPQGPELVLDGKTVVNFSSNDSLGLANHESVKAAAHLAIDRYGAGSGASRLTCGNHEPLRSLEKELARFLGRERALCFSSGYQANTGSIPVLATPGTVVLSDEYNHASLIDGIRLSAAECRVYPHNDVSAMAGTLEDLSSDVPVLVVTESLFSMEGDRALLREIVALKGIRPFTLYLDEAHALGACGPQGRGLAAETGCESDVDVLLGTLGKAFGTSGAFISCSHPLADLLVNRARSLIFSTAPMPAAAAAAEAALFRIRDGDDLRDRLQHNTSRFRDHVRRILGTPVAGIDHIVPVPFEGAGQVMDACEAMLEEGVYCQGIRPPSVPAGGCRLRFSISAAHSDEHVDRAASALAAVLGDGTRRHP